MIGRVRRAFGVLAPEQRLAGVCAIGLFLTMFLPWYTRDTTAVVGGKLQTVGSTLMAFKAFSFVEAAILLVAVGVLVLLFARGERKAFHLPGGDGLVIFAAGAWVALLVFYRLIDNKTGSTTAFQKVDYGVSWGIFVTLLCGLALAYAGQRLRLARGLTYSIAYTRSKLMDDASSVFDASILTGPIANYPVADSFNRRVRKIDLKSGLLTTFAGGGEGKIGLGLAGAVDRHVEGGAEDVAGVSAIDLGFSCQGRRSGDYGG